MPPVVTVKPISATKKQLQKPQEETERKKATTAGPIQHEEEEEERNLEEICEEDSFRVATKYFKRYRAMCPQPQKPQRRRPATTSVFRITSKKRLGTESSPWERSRNPSKTHTLQRSQTTLRTSRQKIALQPAAAKPDAEYMYGAGNPFGNETWRGLYHELSKQAPYMHIRALRRPPAQTDRNRNMVETVTLAGHKMFESQVVNTSVGDRIINIADEITENRISGRSFVHP